MRYAVENVGAAPRGAGRTTRLILLAAWLLLAGWFAAHHVMWRDEVRAFSFAVQGNATLAMLRMLHGEGHPALWYLLLRGGYALTGSVLVLPVLAFAIGAAAATILALRAPFGVGLLALLLSTRFAVYDYTVMARNYGLSMLILFALAALYPRWRTRGIGIGALLALLCNANVHSVVLAVAFLLFHAIDLWTDDSVERRRAARIVLANAGLAALGVAACVAEVYPAHNDIAQLGPPPGGLFAYSLALPVHLGDAYRTLAPDALGAAGAPVVLALLVGSLIALAGAPGALAGAVTALFGLLALFGLVYPGGYRHQALYPVFFATMLWLATDGYGGRATVRPAITLVGRWLFGALILLQVMLTVVHARDVAAGVPESRARDLGALLHRRDLARAIVIGDPDFILEPLRYYAPNPTYLLRERRFGRIFTLTRGAVRAVGFADFLATAQRLHALTGRPVVIVLRDRPGDLPPPGIWPRGSYGALAVVPAEVRGFLAATRRIAHYAPADSGESYDVYRLR